ncbi:glycosyltransferase family 4 protein [Pseudosulfitobacter sp. DSM 107133]|uniref:glycosyltransferase family 4 protein n=1 Tax=Pseudosulfitobacter sp. DSM 107133 TaxID=2883100 RepID=UPI0013B3704A|nr:glycosyltransferase family 4 protein [Pseudosulfitobacter sp. DSM 107133]
MQFDPSLIQIKISEEPVEGADVYHYHRPHLETELKEPAVVTVHHDPRDVDPWLDPKKFWQVYCQTARIVCLNSLQVEDLAAVDMHNTVVIPHGFDTNIFARQKKTFDPTRKLNIGIVSKRYDRRFKGDAYIFESLELFDPDRVRFTLVGAGRALDAARMRELGFEVDVFEYLPYRLFGSLYAQMDFLMMVSTYEGGPANLPEALSSSTPVLATMCGMVPDLIRDGENGVILSGDIRLDAPVLKAIVNNTDGITDRLFEGAHTLDTVISWEDVIALHIRMYSEIVQELQDA